MNKLISEGTVLPVGTRIDKCFNTANWNCHGAGKAGAGICYKKPLRPLGYCWVWVKNRGMLESVIPSFNRTSSSKGKVGRVYFCNNIGTLFTDIRIFIFEECCFHG